MSLAQRPYSRSADLRLMQDAVSRNYDYTLIRTGDIAWRARFHDHSELGLQIHLWESAGLLGGYTWLRSSGGFDIFITGEHKGDSALLSEMLDQIEESMRARLEAGDELHGIYTFFDPADHLMTNHLENRGFAESHDSEGVVLRADLSSIREPPALPPGWTFAAVSESDVIGRVEAHRAANTPSDLTATLYQRARRTWPYRAELDRVVKTDQGVIVAFCTSWIDERNRAGLLEPVGTHPDFRKRGLGKAVVIDALLALKGAGATIAQVGSSGDAAKRTYESAGFTHCGREVTFRKALG